jgi:hypothetical protein
MNEIEFQTLVRELTALPRETEWVGAGLIRLHSGTRRDASYVPFWA